jgi:hypothetical protein
MSQDHVSAETTTTEHQELVQRIRCTLQNVSAERSTSTDEAAGPGWLLLERALNAGAQTLSNLHSAKR